MKGNNHNIIAAAEWKIKKERPPAARKITTKKTRLRLVDELSFSSSLGIFSRIIPSFGRRFQTKESSALESIRELG